MPGLLNHLSGTLERLDITYDVEKENLLGTIKVPRDLGKITEHLPKPQYNKIKRNKSVPAESLCQETNESLLEIAHKMFGDKAPKGYP
jgi:hypothetical protein